jgi:hypothetical protein
MNAQVRKNFTNRKIVTRILPQQQVYKSRTLFFIQFIIIVFIVIEVSSCYSPRYVYSSPTQNIPQLSKKGDVNVAGYFAGGGGSSRRRYFGSTTYNVGVDMHVAYALSDHFGIMLNKFNRWEKNNNANDFTPGDSSVLNYYRGLTELGAGYFTSSKRDSGNYFFQVYGGVALGKFSIHETSLNNGIPFTRFHNSSITKLFVQPAFVFGQRKNFTTAFSFRFNAIFYKKIKTDYNSTELDKYLLNDLSSSPVFFFEPATTFSFGFKKIKGIKLNFQSGFTVLMNRRFVDYRTVNFALGIMANKELFKNKAK